MTEPVCWTLTDGRMGMVSQALGLAEAVGFQTIQKTITPVAPWKWLPPKVWPSRIAGFNANDPLLQPPWPRLLIACGRQAVGPAMAIRRLAAGKTFVVVTQHPRVNPGNFDLVVVPEHDRLTGENVIQTVGSVHRVSQKRLAEERMNPTVDYSHLPRPLIAVSIGGRNKVFDLSPQRMALIADQLKSLAGDSGASLLVTASRRTGPENEALLHKSLDGTGAEVWDGTGTNPYFSALAQADAVLVTEDSVNMVSEACGTGKPTYVIGLDRLNSKPNKFDDFLKRLVDMGAVRLFEGSVSAWNPPILDESARVADEILARLRQAQS